MEILSSRVLIAPVNFDRSVAFYEDTLGLTIYREYGVAGRRTGVVFFLGGGHLELSRSGSTSAQGVVTLWLQVPDVAAEHERLVAAGVTVTDPPRRMPWGLIEMWATDPDGHRLCIVEVPPEHPIRRRLG